MSERRKAYAGDVDGGADTRDATIQMAVREAAMARTHFDLIVFQRAYGLASEIFELTKSFPREEMFSLTDQVRRSTRSTATCISEAWRRRRYPAAFVNKLNESEAEAAETQTWLRFATDCAYIPADASSALIRRYDEVLRMLVNMENHSEAWTIPHLRKGAK